MDTINLIIGINIVLMFVANLGAAKKGIRSRIGQTKEKPKGFFQTYPPYIATLILILLIISLFRLGTLDYNGFQLIRMTGAGLYVLSSWMQVWIYRTLGDNYSQDIVIYKNHQLIEKGLYRYIRHPYYLFQILMDIGAVFATLSYLLVPIVVLEIPILIIRGKIEEKLLLKHFPGTFEKYRNHTGFILPFIG